MVEVNGMSCSLDFIIAANSYSPAIISFYDRSQQLVRSIGASLSEIACTINVYKDNRKIKTLVSGDSFDTFITPVISGKEKFYHAIAISKEVNNNILVFTEDNISSSFFDLLMKNFNLPLLREWSDELYDYFISNNLIVGEPEPLISGKHSLSTSIPLGNKKVSLDSLRCIRLRCNENMLSEGVSNLLKTKKICISNQRQNKLEFTNMDTYFKMYGPSLVTNLENCIKPLTELNGNIDNMCLKHKRLYPQQAAQLNGVIARLRKAKYTIINNGMGTGKTIEGASICEANFVAKWLRENSSKSLKDAYIDQANIHYRHIIMCPGHLTAKWAEEIRNEIPYAKVTILTEFSQLLAIKANGIKRNGKEFFIISKDFAKLSYQLKPTPIKRRSGNIMKKVCKDCDTDVMTVANKCKCGSTNIALEKSGYYGVGMTCPHCKNILIPYKTVKLTPYLDEDEVTPPLDYSDFKNNTTYNSRCYYCNEELWVPHVPNIGVNKHNEWYRATHYANKAHKNKVTVWVHRKYAETYFDSIQETPLNEIDSDINCGVRKIAPGWYIKKQLKGFFDFAIFDEAHLYKAGASAQGNTMHSIIKASKKQLALTGTIAGGYASHLFYLLYRLDPVRMKQRGYSWDDVMKFVEKYGQLEKTFEANVDDSNSIRNVSSRGRQKGSPKEKPGISPLIFMDFLLDSTVFLDLSDMSKYLPPLKEYVECVEIPQTITVNENVITNPELNMLASYNSVIDKLKRLVKDKAAGGGKGILSTLLQYSLSYIDKPYGVAPIKSPSTGEVLVKPPSFPAYSEHHVLLSKERRLVEIINKEIKEGRNCFVFAEYTGSPETCITYRLQDIIERECNLKGKVEVLESASPSASEREAWMHKKAKKGIKVFITNPRNVETGLDFCFKVENVTYNYPTLIFMQLGYSLFTIWQASRRHYRLNQREECRTYYMAVKGTVQEAVISLIAQKMAATSAIQGKFSVEGLSSMAQGVDVKLKLAQALSSMDNDSGSNLQEMFDALNDNDFDDSVYSKYRPMLTLKELLGEDAVVELLPEEMQDADTIFDIFDLFLADFNERNNISSESSVIIGNKLDEKPIHNDSKIKNKRKPEGQISLFA